MELEEELCRKSSQRLQSVNYVCTYVYIYKRRLILPRLKSYNLVDALKPLFDGDLPLCFTLRLNVCSAVSKWLINFYGNL